MPNLYYIKENGIEFYKKDISDLNDALLRIYPRIEMNKIYDIIDNTMYLSLERKEFLKKSVTIRKEKILDVAYKKLNKWKLHFAN